MAIITYGMGKNKSSTPINLDSNSSSSKSSSPSKSSGGSIPNINYSEGSYYDPRTNTGYTQVGNTIVKYNSSGQAEVVGSIENGKVTPINTVDITKTKDLGKGIRQDETTGIKYKLTDVKAGAQAYHYTKSSQLSKFVGSYGREGLPFAQETTQNIYNDKGQKIGEKSSEIGYEGRTYTRYKMNPSSGELKNQSQTYKEKFKSQNPFSMDKGNVQAVQQKETNLNNTTTPTKPVNPSDYNYSYYNPETGERGLGRSEIVFAPYSQQQPKPYIAPLSKQFFQQTGVILFDAGKSLVRGASYLTNPTPSKGKTLFDAPVFKNTAIGSYAGKSEEFFSQRTTSDLFGVGTAAAFIFLPAAKPVIYGFRAIGAEELVRGLSTANPEATSRGVMFLAPDVINKGSKLVKAGVGKVDTYLRGEYVKNINSMLAKNQNIIIAEPRSLQRISKDLSVDVKVSPIESVQGRYTGMTAGGYSKEFFGIKVVEGKPTVLNVNKIPVYDSYLIRTQGQRTDIYAREFKDLSVPAIGNEFYPSITQDISRNILVRPQQFGNLNNIGGVKVMPTGINVKSLSYAEFTGSVQGFNYGTSRDLVRGFGRNSGRSRKVTPIGELLTYTPKVSYTYKLEYKPDLAPYSGDYLRFKALAQFKNAKKVQPEPFKIEIIDTTTGKGFSMNVNAGKPSTSKIVTSFDKKGRGQIIKLQQKPVYILKELVAKPKVKTRARARLKTEFIFRPANIMKPETKTETFGVTAKQRTVQEIFSRQKTNKINEALYKTESKTFSGLTVRTISLSKQKYSTSQGQKVRQSQSVKTFAAQSPASATIPLLGTSTRTALKPATKTASRTVQLSRLTEPMRMLYLKNMTKPKRPVRPFNNNRQSRREYSLGTLTPLRRTYKYQPTAQALALGIKGKEDKIAEMTGLFQRPIGGKKNGI